MRNTEWASPTVQVLQLRAPTSMPLLPGAGVPTQPQPAYNAMLTIDACGCIKNCNSDAEVLLGCTSDVLQGRATTSLIPELPFSSNTPGYNLAYAVFNAANGLWMRRLAVLADGRRIVLDMALSSVVVKFRRYITLSLRLPRAGH